MPTVSTTPLLGVGGVPKQLLPPHDTTPCPFRRLL